MAHIGFATNQCNIEYAEPEITEEIIDICGSNVKLPHQ